eukprot:5241950-Pyramimonas_sp.AAC.1
MHQRQQMHQPLTSDDVPAATGGGAAPGAPAEQAGDPALAAAAAKLSQAKFKAAEQATAATAA